MEAYKPLNITQKDGEPYCAIYAIINSFNLNINQLRHYLVEGAGAKEVEFIIQEMINSKYYIQYLEKCTYPSVLPIEVVEERIMNLRRFTDDRFIVLYVDIRAKNNRLHNMHVWLSKDKLVVLDSRQQVSVLMTVEEFLNTFKVESLGLFLEYQGYKKSTLITLRQ